MESSPIVYEGFTFNHYTCVWHHSIYLNHILFLLIRQKYYLQVKQYSVIVGIVIICTAYRLSSASAGAESAGLAFSLAGHLSRT
jgi:hypothetical protein